MTGRTIMVQGTMSHVGKTVLVAALCRLFAQDGVHVAPFKAQNMSLNSYVTPQGGEIGRAQAMQAEAAGIEPTVQMNPILLKPESDHRSQVVVLGKPKMRTSARDYYRRKTELWPVVAEALDDLRREYELVVVEGAGSPAEINLMAQDIVNMRVARHAEAPVVLVGDIDRGGVFASLVGTLSLLEAPDRALVGALVINKFRGDRSILDPGLRFLEEHTGVPVAGVLPYVGDLGIAEEDSLGLERADEPLPTDTVLDIAVIRLPHIANFDDFDPLRREPGVLLRYVSALPELGTPDLIILPGTKTTMADLSWLRERGLDRAVIDGQARGTPVFGVCGGYQMLGEAILDPDRVESDQGHAQGLGLLPVTTVFSATKATHRVNAVVATAGSGLLQECGGQRLQGYEIHMGRTTGSGVASPFRIVERSGQAVDQPDGADGAMDARGRVLGTYMHGLFRNDGFRRAVLRRLAQWKGVTLPEATGDDASGLGYDGLAALVREHLDMPLIYRLAGLEQGAGLRSLG